MTAAPYRIPLAAAKEVETANANEGFQYQGTSLSLPNLE